VGFGEWVLRMVWREQMAKIGQRLLVGILFVAWLFSGQAQSLNQYGWSFELPFSFLRDAVSGLDGALYIGGSADDFRFRGVNYPSTTEADIVVLRILPSGALGWGARFGGGGNDQLEFLSISDSGHLIVGGNEAQIGNRQWIVDATGQTVATLDEAGNRLRVPLDSGGGFTEPSNGLINGGFRVLDDQAEFVWTRKTHSLDVRAVSGLADNTIIAIGEVRGFDQGRIGKSGRIPDGDEEWIEIRGPVMARFAADGELLWAKSAVDPVRILVSGLTASIDENGNAVFGGTFSNALRLGSHRLETRGGEGSFLRNAFVASWDREGNVKWIKHLASDAGSNVHSIAMSSDWTAPTLPGSSTIP
jgi:hypothetical protein